jgi:mRNA export factor
MLMITNDGNHSPPVRRYLTPARESETFAFKCHRPTATDVFAVNDIAFCKATGTFATCGADGSYCFWDKDSKTRLNQFERADAPLTCCAFNQSGSLFAYVAASQIGFACGVELKHR